MAHPVDIFDQIPEETASKRAVDAALGILKACLASKTVKRVVYTSSIAAVLASGNGQPVVDESSWSDIEFYRSQKRPGVSYLAAKTRTEKAVHEFAEEFGLDVVTLNPSLVVGPFICPSMPPSVAFGLSMILGIYLLTLLSLISLEVKKKYIGKFRTNQYSLCRLQRSI